jgi:hypothetical protein
MDAVPIAGCRRIASLLALRNDIGTPVLRRRSRVPHEVNGGDSAKSV